MTTLQQLQQCAWLVAKDLLREYRAPRAWPAMLLLGCALVALLDIQLDLPDVWKVRAMSGLLWMSIFFAGTLVLERSFQSEREDGCWQALRLYPVAPGIIFASKVVSCFVALLALELVLVPAFAALSGVTFQGQWLALIVVLLLTNAGFAAVGTVTSALVSELRQRSNLLAVLVFPLLVPLILAAAEATRLLCVGERNDTWWWWLQLIGCFSALFLTVGTIVFPMLMEE